MTGLRFPGLRQILSRISSKHKDLQRVQADEVWTSRIRIPKEREAYWNELATQSSASSLIGLLEMALPLQGDVVECGVFRGHSTRMIARSLMDIAPDKTLYACDSFEGFPENRLSSEDTTLFRPLAKLRKKFRAADDVPSRLNLFFKVYGIKGEIKRGYFEHTLPQLSDCSFCFMHVDCDTYGSHIECLNHLYDQVVPGGIVVFDDYREPRWPGATRAIDTFFATRTEKPQLLQSRKIPAWYVRKPDA